ncbi:MAG: sugar transferase [Sedimentisphaerales bacterium]|nr:sugar transferase [Sedimentisphaerales bacterium]
MKLFNICKRGLDFLISLLAFAILCPVLVIIAIAIRLESKGAAVFKQERAGKLGKTFVFYKFRTMKQDTEPFGPSPKSEEDVRLTKIGTFLREYSLDELPQFYNILKGDMSLVGPRPLYVSQIKEWNERQKKRLLVKPGLTGLAQIKGRGQLTQEEKLELDIQYVENAGLFADMKILLATFLIVFKKKNIYENRYSQAECTRGDKS